MKELVAEDVLVATCDLVSVGDMVNDTDPDGQLDVLAEPEADAEAEEDLEPDEVPRAERDPKDKVGFADMELHCDQVALVVDDECALLVSEGDGESVACDEELSEGVALVELDDVKVLFTLPEGADETDPADDSVTVTVGELERLSILESVTLALPVEDDDRDGVRDDDALEDADNDDCADPDAVDDGDHVTLVDTVEHLDSDGDAELENSELKVELDSGDELAVFELRGLVV